jgi:hypothetical protein
MRKNIVTIIGTASFIGVLIFAIYYPYKFFSWMWVLDFSGPSGWQVLYFVEEGVEVPAYDRALHFAMWLPSVTATQISLLAALFLIWRVLKQDYFEVQTITALQVAGIAAAIGATFNLLIGSIDGWFLTRFNSDEKFSIQFRFESGEMGVLLTGIGLFLLGWVIRLALLKRTENSEII